MALPATVPTAREINFGKWPVKTFRFNNGAEIRRLFGNRRTEMELTLTYENISDNAADSFKNHYESVNGEFEAFDIPSETYQGWSAGNALFVNSGNRWRYKEPPTVENIKPGISTVKVILVSVLRW